MQIKEQQDACRLQHTEKFAVGEHAWISGYRTDCEGVTIVDTLAHGERGDAHSANTFRMSAHTDR